MRTYFIGREMVKKDTMRKRKRRSYAFIRVSSYPPLLFSACILPTATYVRNTTLTYHFLRAALLLATTYIREQDL